MKKYYEICVISLFIIFMSIYIYIGHMTYNIFINKNNDNHFDELIYVSQDKKEESRKWYEQYAKNVEIISEDGYKLKGSYINQGSQLCVIVVHGYRNDKNYMLKQVKEFTRLGYDVLAIDLRGHGESDGSSIGLGVVDFRDIQLWIDYVKDMNRSKHIVLYGVSMGAVSLLNQSYDDILCIISDSSYDDLYHLYHHHFQIHPIIKKYIISTLRFTVLYKDHYDIYQSSPITNIIYNKTPILYIHGTYDSIVPIEHMYNLYNKTSSIKEYYVVSKRHGECFKDKNYFKKISYFINWCLMDKK